jgi:hypothetical protein
MTDPQELLWNHAIENCDFEEAARLQKQAGQQHVGEVVTASETALDPCVLPEINQ